MTRFGRLYSRSWDGIDVDDKLIIPQEKLFRILRLLVDHVAPEPGTELTVGQDFLWTVLPARLYDPYEEPDELTLADPSGRFQTADGARGHDV